MPARRLIVLLAIVAAVPNPAAAQDEDYERAPIHYSTSTPDDPVAHLAKRIERGQAALTWTDAFGYLPALLRELDIPASSQGLVFSRTSLQRQKISPSTPRAIYFSDDVYVGYVQGGGLIEIAAVDPKLGPVFYTIDNETGGADAPQRPVRIVREIDNCMGCHGRNMPTEIPNLQLRSVFPDARGNPILAGGFRGISQASPLENRWGGWYLTGNLGPQRTMANTTYKPRKGLEDPEPLAGAGDGAGAGARITNLSKFIDTRRYLTPHSDPVALMLLEHQVEAHNRITHATQATQRALHDEKIINDALGEKRPAGAHAPSTLSRMKAACEPLVEYLLFSGEAKLASPITGTSGFAAEFAARGVRDPKGRSLRDLDFRTRMMRYPLSYLIYSPAFEQMPELAKQHVYRRLWHVLTGVDTSAPFAHLTQADRAAIIEIVAETGRDLPGYWKRSP